MDITLVFTRQEAENLKVIVDAALKGYGAQAGDACMFFWHKINGAINDSDLKAKAEALAQTAKAEPEAEPKNEETKDK